MPNVILTSSFSTVAQELNKRGALPNKSQRVAFIPTAGNCYRDKPWQEADRKALADLGYSVFDVDLKGTNAARLKEQLESSDIIFVAGGNTTYLVEFVHASGFDTMIRNLLSHGRIYIGSSAGSILAGPSVEPFIEEDRSELLQDFVLHDSTGLNLVDYVILPHYPENAETDDRIEKQFSKRLKFLKMTDNDYRVESYE